MATRQAGEEDAGAISALILPLAAKYISHEISDAGRRHLLESMAEDHVRQYFRDGMKYHVYETAGQIVGVVATRDNRHLFNLFVAEAVQRRGIARLLWEVARHACMEAGGNGSFTVNASRYAVPMYEKFGFRRDGDEVTTNDVIVVPMRVGTP